MKSNQEIDALVTEKVMGASVCKCDPQRESPRFSADTGACLTCGNQIGGNYSTNPAASTQLLDKMVELGWAWDLCNILGCIRARFWKLPESKATKFAANGATKELAVALAALKAHGVEVDG